MICKFVENSELSANWFSDPVSISVRIFSKASIILSQNQKLLASHWYSTVHWHIIQWRHNGCDGVSNRQPHHCLRNRLFRRRSKKTSKLRVTGLCAGNPTVTGEFPEQRASNAENVSFWWRHNVKCHITSQGMIKCSNGTHVAADLYTIYIYS